MSSGELSLLWDDHHNTLVEVFVKLLKTSSLVDCTIAAEGQYLKAHKIVLSACSPYFELLFNQENEKNPIVVLKDVKFQELKAIIDFVYCGNVSVPEDRLGDFIDAAESLQIKGLGGDNYKLPNSESVSERRESPHPQKQEIPDSSSPVPCKRCISLRISEDNVSEICSEINANVEYQTTESVPQGEMQVDRLGHQVGPHSTPESVLSKLCPASVTVHRIQRSVETDSPASFAEPSPGPLLGMHSNPDVMIIKTEPEPVEEVSLPEMDFEPKVEDDVEDRMVLDSEDEAPEAVINVDTHSSSSQDTGADVAFRTSCRQISLPKTTEKMLPGACSLRDFPVSAGRPVAHEGAVAASTRISIAARNSSRIADRRPRKHGCLLCGRTFRTPSHLTVHMRTHTGDRPFKCDYCGKGFTQKGALQTHQRTHTGDRPFKCDTCSMGFTQKGTLQMHQRFHTGSRPFKCDSCGKGFTHKGNLQMHQRIHTGFRPFKCDSCGKGFTQKGDLQKHQRFHTGDRPFKCDYCGKGFMQKGDLQRHQRTHTGDRPFKCDYCGKGFTQKGVLQRHVRIHTR